MYVKPRKGLKILRPDTQKVLLDCGEHVPKTAFWIRRLKDGDVELASTSQAKAKPEVKKEIKPEVKKEETKIIQPKMEDE